jgi:hypothetical protein
MKSKDQIHGENRALKQQLTKTTEVITKVQEAEKSLGQKMVTLRTHHADIAISRTAVVAHRGYSSHFRKEAGGECQKGN